MPKPIQTLLAGAVLGAGLLFVPAANADTSCKEIGGEYSACATTGQFVDVVSLASPRPRDMEQFEIRCLSTGEYVYQSFGTLSKSQAENFVASYCAVRGPVHFD